MPIRQEGVAPMELGSLVEQGPSSMVQGSQVSGQVQAYQQEQQAKTIDINKFKKSYENATSQGYKGSTSDFAGSLKSEGYIVSGFDEYQKNKAQGLYKNNANKAFKTMISSLATGFKDFGSNLVQSATERSEQIGENYDRLSGKGLAEGATFMAGLAKEGAGFIQDAIGEVVTGLAKTTWNSLDSSKKEQISGFATNILESKVAQEGLKLIEKGGEAYANFEENNPDAAIWVGAIANVGLTYADIVGASQTLKGAKATANTAKQGLKQAYSVSEDVWKNASNVTRDGYESILSKVKNIGNLAPEEASVKVANKLLEQIEGSKYLSKNLDKKMTDVIDTLAQNPNYLPDVNIAAKSFDTKNAVGAIKSDITNISDNLGSLFVKADETMKPISSQNIIDNVTKFLINEKNRAKYIVAGEGVFDNITNTVQRLTKSYPDGVPRQALRDVRKSVDDVINTISDTNIQKSIRSDFRKALATTIEESVPSGNKSIVKQAMKELQKRIEAKDYLETILEGSKIQGGKLTDIIRNAVSSDIGKTVGVGVGGAIGAVPGAVAGYAASNQIGKRLAKNAISSSAERKALSKFIKTNPGIIDEIQDLMKTMDIDEVSNIKENIVDLVNKVDDIPTKTKQALNALPDGSSKVETISPEGVLSKKSNIEIIPESKVVSKDLQPLYEEAKKYKSADEFIDKMSDEIAKTRQTYTLNEFNKVNNKSLTPEQWKEVVSMGFDDKMDTRYFVKGIGTKELDKAVGGKSGRITQLRKIREEANK